MFQIIGDRVEFEGWPICTLRGDIPATVRERLEHSLDIRDIPYEDVRERADDLESECNELRSTLAEATGQRDAYAAILGVTT